MTPPERDSAVSPAAPWHRRLRSHDLDPSAALSPGPPGHARSVSWAGPAAQQRAGVRPLLGALFGSSHELDLQGASSPPPPPEGKGEGKPSAPALDNLEAPATTGRALARTWADGGGYRARAGRHPRQHQTQDSWFFARAVGEDPLAASRSYHEGDGLLEQPQPPNPKTRRRHVRTASAGLKALFFSPTQEPRGEVSCPPFGGPSSLNPSLNDLSVLGGDVCLSPAGSVVVVPSDAASSPKRTRCSPFSPAEGGEPVSADAFHLPPLAPSDTDLAAWANPLHHLDAGRRAPDAASAVDDDDTTVAYCPPPAPVPAPVPAPPQRNARLAKKSLLYWTKLPWQGVECGDVEAPLTPRAAERREVHRLLLEEDFKRGLTYGAVLGPITCLYTRFKEAELVPVRPTQTPAQKNESTMAMLLGMGMTATLHVWVCFVGAYVAWALTRELATMYALVAYFIFVVAYTWKLFMLQTQQPAADDDGPAGKIYGVRMLRSRHAPAPPDGTVTAADVAEMHGGLRRLQGVCVGSACAVAFAAFAALFTEGFRTHSSVLAALIPVACVGVYAVHRLAWARAADSRVKKANRGEALVQGNVAWVLRRSRVSFAASLWLVRRVPTAKDLTLQNWQAQFHLCDVHFRQLVRTVLLAGRRWRQRAECASRHVEEELLLYMLEFLLSPDLHSVKHLAKERCSRSKYLF